MPAPVQAEAEGAFIRRRVAEVTWTDVLFGIEQQLIDPAAVPELADPLDDVETVYAEFDYPPEVGRFVRYMPSDEPDLGSRERNEARLVEKWERYLEENQERFRDVRI